MIEIFITDTTQYRKRYTRAEVIALLLTDPEFDPEGLAALSDGALALLVLEERPGAFRDDLAPEREVTDCGWQTAYEKPGEPGWFTVAGSRPGTGDST